MASARLLCVVRQDFYQQVHGVLRRNLLRKQQVSILLTFQVVFIHVNTILYSDSWIVNIAKFHRYTVCARSGHLKCLIWTHWRRLKWTLIDYLVPLCHNNDYISCCLVKSFLTFFNETGRIYAINRSEWSGFKKWLGGVSLPDSACCKS